MNYVQISHDFRQAKREKDSKSEAQLTAPRGTSAVIDKWKTGQKFIYAALNWNPQAFFCLNIILIEYYILLEQINSKLLFFYPVRGYTFFCSGHGHVLTELNEDQNSLQKVL